MMQLHRLLPLAIAAAMAVGCATTPSSPKTRGASPTARSNAATTPESVTVAAAAAADQVTATERAFARTMAVRDFASFVKFLSPDAVFFSGNEVKRGSAEVAMQWAPYFDSPTAPFSWAPDHVEVLASGDLALSTGPVYQQGKLVGRYNSIWRREGPNAWHIVFDKGEAVCAKP
jgi:ketosteroid isomerase-like protein